MKLLAGLVIAALTAGLVTEGIYVSRTRRQVEALTAEVQQLAAEREAAGEGDRPAWRQPSLLGGGAGADDEGERGAREAGRLPPPRFITPPSSEAAPAAGAPGAVPLPPVLDSPEAREQLRQFVSAELKREREEQRERAQQRREEEERRRVEAMAKNLGLNERETQRFGEVLSSVQDARRQLRDKIESGQMQRDAIGREFAALREKTDQQLKEVLGDERMKKFQDLQRQQRGGRGSPEGRGGPEGGWGRRGGPPGGPQAGGPPGASAGPGAGPSPAP